MKVLCNNRKERIKEVGQFGRLRLLADFNGLREWVFGLVDFTDVDKQGEERYIQGIGFECNVLVSEPTGLAGSNEPVECVEPAEFIVSDAEWLCAETIHDLLFINDY